MEDTPQENTNPVEMATDIPQAPDLTPTEPIKQQSFQEWIEAKWERQLSYQSMNADQQAASITVCSAIKDCVMTILRTVPACVETDRALGQIEVALMCLNKAIALHPELKTQDPK